jgi:hypothetical protein
MSSGSQRVHSELNSVDDPSGESYAQSDLVVRQDICTIIAGRQGWCGLPTMFVNSSRRSHVTCRAEEGV